MFPRIDQCDGGSDKSSVGNICGQQRVHLGGDAFQRIISSGDGPKIGSTCRDQQGRADAVAGGVGDGDDEAAVG